MQHLDEGILSALLDGELTGTEQREAEAHLHACAECSSRLQELRGFMADADLLVASLGEPVDIGRLPLSAAPARPKYRAWAWAASILLVVGSGLAARYIFLASASRATVVAASRSATEARLTPPSVSSPEKLPQQQPADQPSAGSVEDTGAPTLAERGNAAPLRDAREPQPRQEARRSATTGAIARDSLPAQRIEAALALQPGVVAAPTPGGALSIRGGRANAPDTYVGGVPVKPGNRGTGFRAASDSGISIGTNGFENRSLRDSSRDVATAAGGGEAAAAKQSQSNYTAPRSAPQDEVTSRRERANEQPPFQRVTMEEAVHHLGGTIRLIDGLAPDHVEARIGATDSTGRYQVRIVYLVDGKMLFLDQMRSSQEETKSAEVDAQSSYSGPPAEGEMSKSLEWNDIGGFHLALSGPFSTALLRQLKTGVK